MDIDARAVGQHLQSAPFRLQQGGHARQDVYVAALHQGEWRQLRRVVFKLDQLALACKLRGNSMAQTPSADSNERVDPLSRSHCRVNAVCAGSAGLVLRLQPADRPDTSGQTHQCAQLSKPSSDTELAAITAGHLLILVAWTCWRLDSAVQQD